MKQVLVVDDDAVSRLMLSHMLSGQGFDVTEASSVDEAVVATDDSTFDLIVCDYIMPGRDGLDFLDVLAPNSPPFILLTGHADRESISDNRVDRISSYLTKPVSTDELTKAVEQVLLSRSA